MVLYFLCLLLYFFFDFSRIFFVPTKICISTKGGGLLFYFVRGLESSQWLGGGQTLFPGGVFLFRWGYFISVGPLILELIVYRARVPALHEPVPVHVLHHPHPRAGHRRPSTGGPPALIICGSPHLYLQITDFHF